MSVILKTAERRCDQLGERGLLAPLTASHFNGFLSLNGRVTEIDEGIISIF